MISASILRKYALLLPLSGLAVACGSGGEPVKIAGGKPAAGAPAAADKISQINVLVDASGGMQGFMHANAPGESGSNFQQTVAALLSDVNGQHGAPAAYYFVKEATGADPRILVPTSYGALTGAVSTGIQKPALGTELPLMLAEALKLHAKRPGTVSLIVSDFIYSPKNSGETWRVKTDVKDALATADAAQLAVSVFANTSAYRGNFYPGNRTKPQALRGDKLPYYIWVVGAPALVGQVDGTLLKRLASQPQAHFNTKFAPPYAALDHFQNQGEWYKAEPIAGVPALSFTKSVSRKEPAEVVFGLDLKAVPAEWQKAAAQGLRLDAAATDATLLRTWPVAQEPAAAGKPYLQQYTHLAKIKLGQVPGAGALLHLTLPRPQPAWVAQTSTANDSNIAKQGPKTFLLADVMQGVADYFAGQPSAQQALDLPIRVQRAD
ncbi:hypothetical protein [Hymenobacter coccineus]|uniref:VWFA domain-containing protein n=1 Tax=Hymenobacter coccineus TaxID=1908235 RepID=A0A1G1TET0_9BACT|nr:hypothetical protein [Hymenobacter coccineus]OGX89377.1 hypothetical protein BEN49_09140 [Hymenobacter coccineus]